MNSREKIITKRHNYNRFVFKASYCLFYLSFFLLDIEQNTYDWSTISSLVRYAALSIGMVGLFIVAKFQKKGIMTFIIVFVFGLFSFALTHTTFFLGLGILSLYAVDIDGKEMIKLSLKMLVILTVATVLLQCLGVFENVLTKRWASRDIFRQSYGFYHSNVLPLNFMYITAYYLILRSKTIKIYKLLIIVLIATVLFIYCDSRNAYMVVVLMCVFVAIEKVLKILSKPNKVFGFLAKYIVLICSVLSIGGALLLSNIKQLKLLDYVLSYRLSLSQQMIKQFGLHFVAFINRESYASGAKVIDNGYLLIAIRYGLLYIVLLCVIGYYLGRKIKGNLFYCIIMVMIAISNLIDNDLFDYSCLPFLLIGIKAVLAEKTRVRMNFLNNNISIVRRK